jgi:hypothetical protein
MNANQKRLMNAPVAETEIWVGPHWIVEKEKRPLPVDSDHKLQRAFLWMLLPGAAGLGFALWMLTVLVRGH